jgi:hypothetical protein
MRLSIEEKRALKVAEEKRLATPVKIRRRVSTDAEFERQFRPTHIAMAGVRRHFPHDQMEFEVPLSEALLLVNHIVKKHRVFEFPGGGTQPPAAASTPITPPEPEPQPEPQPEPEPADEGN